MKKKNILEKCDYYTELFKIEDNLDRDNLIDYIDFLSTHLQTNSNLAFQVHELQDSKEYVKHIKRVKTFISENGSEQLHKKKNILSNFNNTSLMVSSFPIIVFFIVLGYNIKPFISKYYPELIESLPSFMTFF